MLRTDFLALSTFYTLVCAFSAVASYQPFFLMCCGSFVSVQCQVIHRCERTGDSDFHRAYLCTVIAGCTWDQRNFAHRLSCLVQSFLLAFRKTVKVLHKGKVVFHLRDVAHSGKYGDHALQVCCKTDRPGCCGCFRLCCL